MPSDGHHKEPHILDFVKGQGFDGIEASLSDLTLVDLDSAVVVDALRKRDLSLICGGMSTSGAALCHCNISHA